MTYALIAIGAFIAGVVVMFAFFIWIDRTAGPRF